MSSRQGCKWPPGLARPRTAGSSTVSGRFSGKKGRRHFGKGQQVDSGAPSTVAAWLSCPRHPGIKSALSVFSSSSVPVLASVRGHSGHLRAAAAVVLHRFWRPVSAANSPSKKSPTPNACFLCFQTHFGNAEKRDATGSFKTRAWRATGSKSFLAKKAKPHCLSMQC